MTTTSGAVVVAPIVVGASTRYSRNWVFLVSGTRCMNGRLAISGSPLSSDDEKVIASSAYQSSTAWYRPTLIGGWYRVSYAKYSQSTLSCAKA